MRKTTQSGMGVKRKERFYIGGFEDYLEYNGAGATTLERETLHGTDDKCRIALVERRIGSTNTMRYQFDNHLGTACLELDSARAVITYEEYYPYLSSGGATWKRLYKRDRGCLIGHDLRRRHGKERHPELH